MLAPAFRRLMKPAGILAAATAAFALAQPAAAMSRAAPCDDWLADAQVQRLTNALDAIAAAPDVWAGFSIANLPIAIAGTSEDEAHHCATLWRANHAPPAIALAEAPPLPLQLYGFYSSVPMGEDVDPAWTGLAASMQRTAPEIEAALAAMGEERVMILRAPLRYDKLGQLGTLLEQMGMDPVELLARLAVHESFHLHAQFPALLDQPTQTDWPGWLAMTDRNALIAQCYEGSDAIRAAREVEMGHLLAAWDALYTATPVDRAAAAKAARQFIQARHDRYALLADIRLQSSRGPTSCQQAENDWELIEGTAQWVGSHSAFATGLTTTERARATFTGGANLPFYTSGSFQAWVMDRWLGRDGFLTITRHIAAATGPGTALFDRFSDVFAAPSDSGE